MIGGLWDSHWFYEVVWLGACETHTDFMRVYDWGPVRLTLILWECMIGDLWDSHLFHESVWLGACETHTDFMRVYDWGPVRLRVKITLILSLLFHRWDMKHVKYKISCRLKTVRSMSRQQEGGPFSFVFRKHFQIRIRKYPLNLQSWIVDPYDAPHLKIISSIWIIFLVYRLMVGP